MTLRKTTNQLLEEVKRPQADIGRERKFKVDA